MSALMPLEHVAVDEGTNLGRNYARRWWILGVLGVAQMMVILDGTIVNIALPSAQHSLGFSNADRQWIVTAYSLSFGSLLLFGGRIGDVLGRKRVLITGLIGFALASAVGGASVNFVMLVIARAVQGAFGALLAPSILALLTTTFLDPEERGKAFGIYGAVAGAGGALGLLLGGVLTSYASWRWTLFVNIALAVAATIGASLWLRDDKGADHDPIDLPGLLLVGAGLFGVVFGFSHAETAAWSNPVTIASLCAGVTLLVVFAYFETRAKFPLLPPRVVLNRVRGGSLIVMLSASIGTFGVFLFLTYYLQTTLGFSPVKTGIAFLPLIAALSVVAQISNRSLLPRFGPKPIVPIGLLIAAAASVGLHSLGVHSSYAGRVLPALLVLGVGSGLSVAPAFSTGTLGLAPQDAGVGSATLNTAQQVGGSIGTALLNTLAASAAASYFASHAANPRATAAAAVHGETTAFLWSAIVYAVGAVVAGLLLPDGDLSTLSTVQPPSAADAETSTPARTHHVRVRVGCR
jgi:EmrB/QacA subfamily drug resistance transporter